MNPSSVSIILPTYNESGHILDLIQAVTNVIPSGWQYNILVIDDNSPDGTYKIVNEAFAGDPHIIPILRESNRGLARSIKTGIDFSDSEFVVVMDSDFTHDPAEIPRFLYLAQMFNLVSGSRFCCGGRMQDTSHYFASMLFNWLLRIILHTQIQDNLGGYWVAKTEIVKKLPLESIFFGYGDYFFRLLQHIKNSGASIIEAPAIYRLRKTGSSKSSFLKMFFMYAFAAFYLRIEIRSKSMRRTR